MTWHLNEEEFRRAWQRLNALCGIHDRWMSPRARNTYTDEFGVEIPARETYYKREAGGYPIRLSRTSMERLLLSVVASCPHVESVADLLLEAEAKRMREIADAMSA